MSVLLLTAGGTDNLLLADSASDLLLSGAETTSGSIAQTLPGLTQDMAGTSGDDVSGSIAQTLPALTQSAVGGRVPEAAIAQTLPALRQSAAGSGGPASGTIGSTLPALVQSALGSSSTVDPDTGEATATTGWQVRAVTETGTTVATVAANVEQVRRERLAREEATLSIATTHPDAKHLHLFDHEIQLWLDGSLYGWFRPARVVANRNEGTDRLTAQCVGLSSYFDDVVVGGTRENHITSPHEDPSLVGSTPSAWTKVGGIEDWAIVDNNATFWQTAKAIQLNNSEAGQDAYIRQRVTVPAELDNRPFAAVAEVYISDDEGGSPAWGGPALKNRGLGIQRRDGAGAALSKVKFAEIGDETPRNTVVRLQTPEVWAQEGQQIEIRLYSPDAFVAWRFAAVYDGRWVGVFQKDKSLAVTKLVDHAQDISIGKQNHRITADVESIGQTITRRWPWWRRDNVGEQIRSLVDTFDVEMAVTATTRSLKVRKSLGVKRGTVVKADLAGWSLGEELELSASRIIRQGEGFGIGRDEWIASDTSAMGGHLRERLDFGMVGEGLQQLRDRANKTLGDSKNIRRLPAFTVTGDDAKNARPYDRWDFSLTHGWASFVGEGRATAVTLDGRSLVATLDLEPV